MTGSSDGIGYAVARSLAREGARLVLCARRETPLAEASDSIVKETGAEVLAVRCDVQRLDDVQRLVKETAWSASASFIFWSTMREAFQAYSSPISTMRSGIRCWRKLFGFIRMTREVYRICGKVVGGGSLHRRYRRMGAEQHRNGGGAEQCRGDQLDEVNVAPLCG